MKYGEDNYRHEEVGVSNEESVDDKKNHISQEEEVKAELQKFNGNDFTDFMRLKLHRNTLLHFFKGNVENGETEKVPNSFHDACIYLNDRLAKRKSSAEENQFC